MPMRFLLADVTIDWDLPENEVHAWFHRDGVFGALPFGGQKWRLIIERTQDGAALDEEVTLSLVQQLAAERVAQRSMRIHHPIWLSDFRINARMVDRFRDRRVFVAGDAAHIHSPLGGQGIATGIQDGSNLAWKLFAVLREGAPDSLLDTFDEERKPVARTVLRGTSAASNLVFTMNPVLRLVRERIVFPIMRTAFTQRLLFAKVSQLEVRYRSSLAVHEKGTSAGVRVRAGDRAPDVVFAKAENKVSMFEMLGRFGWLALLGPSGNNRRIIDPLGRLNIYAVVVSDEGELRDVYGDFVRLYGASGPFLYLIRPDGHVGLFQGEADPKPLARYLQKLRAAEAVAKSFHCSHGL